LHCSIHVNKSINKPAIKEKPPRIQIQAIPPDDVVWLTHLATRMKRNLQLHIASHIVDLACPSEVGFEISISLDDSFQMGEGQLGAFLDRCGMCCSYRIF
jgi:hypothetical protein